MNDQARIPGSFRDPSGFLFHRAGRLYRQVNALYQTEYDRLLGSGLYSSLVDAHLLVPHAEVGNEIAQTAEAYKVIQPEPVPFVSYPYEWSFGQLRDAALATLQIQKQAMEYGMSLKDASAYNIQFMYGKPALIDTLSFETYREGEPWVAYRQFCQHFLAPLALMSHRDVRLGQLLRIYIDGIPLDLASALLPVRTRLSFGLTAHLHLHAKSQRHFAGKEALPTERKMSRMSFLGLIDNLERAVRGLEWQPGGTEWVDYADETSYSTAAMEHKERIVASFLDKVEGDLAWDLGANTGHFSRLAADRGLFTVSADADPACVEVNYAACAREGETQILPLLLDLTNPSPATGWENRERMSLSERGPADVVLALALIHHLAISNNLPLGRIASFFAAVCRWLIIEFVPKSDSQVQRLLATRQDIFPGYTQSEFEGTFARHYVIESRVQLDESDRVMYLMERKSGIR